MLGDRFVGKGRRGEILAVVPALGALGVGQVLLATVPGFALEAYGRIPDPAILGLPHFRMDCCPMKEEIPDPVDGFMINIDAHRFAHPLPSPACLVIHSSSPDLDTKIRRPILNAGNPGV